MKIQTPFKTAVEWLERFASPGFRFEKIMGEEYVRKTRAMVLATEGAAERGEILFHEYCDPFKGSWAFVHPSTHPECPGMFRFTVFDRQGWVMHEDCFETSRDAFFEMLTWGYRVPDFGALKRAMKGSLWGTYPGMK